MTPQDFFNDLVAGPALAVFTCDLTAHTREVHAFAILVTDTDGRESNSLRWQQDNGNKEAEICQRADKHERPTGP